VTVEELIGCDAAKLEAMTPEELDKHFQQYYPVTRPERNIQQTKKQEQQMVKTNPQLAKALAVAKSLGIDMGDSLMPVKRRK